MTEDFDTPRAERADSTERAEKIFQDLLHNRHVRFFAVGLGHVTGIQGEAGTNGMGVAGFIYNHDKKRMVSESSRDGMQVLATTFDTNDGAAFETEINRKEIPGIGLCVYARVNVPGSPPGSKLMRDRRPDVRGLTVGLIFDNPANLEVTTDETIPMLNKFLTSKEYQALLYRVLGMFATEHIPDYFKEIAAYRGQWLERSRST